MVNLGALRGFFPAALLSLPNESKKQITLDVISMSLTLESVALSGTCQAGHKQKKENKYFYQH